MSHEKKASCVWRHVWQEFVAVRGASGYDSCLLLFVACRPLFYFFGSLFFRGIPNKHVKVRSGLVCICNLPQLASFFSFLDNEPLEVN